MSKGRPLLGLYAYRRGDLDRFTPRADFVRELAAVKEHWADGQPKGRAWTLVSHSRGLQDDILGVGGLYPWGAAYWEAWAIAGDLSPREWVEARRLAAQVLDGFELFNAPEAISATARLELAGAEPFLEKLGFDPKGDVVDTRVGDDVRYRYMVRAA